MAPQIQIHAKINSFTIKHKAFADPEIIGLSSKVYKRAAVVDSRTLRLVLDQRHINEFIHLNKYKYEDLKTLFQMLSKSEFLNTFDLKSGYHHVEIHPSRRKCLGFK